MASIILLAVIVAIAVALLGSVLLQSLTPINDIILSPLEKKCQEIANEGYKIHTLYPTSNPDELLEADMKRLLYLDNMWIKECVSILPAESIINIVNNVEREISYGE
jgi:LPS O-antigen subunit length determinant protein (WzzB/FepE family)